MLPLLAGFKPIAISHAATLAIKEARAKAAAAIQAREQGPRSQADGESMRTAVEYTSTIARQQQERDDKQYGKRVSLGYSSLDVVLDDDMVGTYPEILFEKGKVWQVYCKAWRQFGIQGVASETLALKRLRAAYMQGTVVTRDLDKAAEFVAKGRDLFIRDANRNGATRAIAFAVYTLAAKRPEYAERKKASTELAIHERHRELPQLVAFTRQQDERFEEGDFVSSHDGWRSNDRRANERLEAREDCKSQSIILRDLHGNEIARTFSYEQDAPEVVESVSYRTLRRPASLNFAPLALDAMHVYEQTCVYVNADGVTVEYKERVLGLGVDGGEAWISSTNAGASEMLDELRRLLAQREARITSERAIMYRLRILEEERAARLHAQARSDMLTAKARAALESEKAQRAEKAQALQARAEVVTAALQQQRAMAAEQEAEIEAAVREAASAEAQNALEDRAASCFCQQLKGLTATFIRAVELESQWTYRDHRWMRIHSNQVVA